MLAGRLQDFVPAWRSITSDPMILQWVRGYKIPFTHPVKQTWAHQEPQLSEREFKDHSNAILQLLNKGAVSRCVPCKGQFLSTYFLVEKPNKDKRFILNLKKLNEFIAAPHFKMEDSKAALRLLHRFAFMASIDLKDSYFLVSVHKEFRKYLRFKFNGYLYEFNCLPFGLCTAPYVFTKLLKPVAHTLRSNGLISVIYLDDLLLIGASKTECMNNIQETRSLLESLGFVLNLEKCQLEPSMTCKFLGFIFNTKEFQVELTDKKKTAIKDAAAKMLNKNRCKIREMAHLVGILVAACPAVKYGVLYTKNLERGKFLALEKSNGNFDEWMTISENAKLDLDWWIRKIPVAANPIREERYKLEIFSDASLTGWGVCCNKIRSHGWWDAEEQVEHINLLELKAAFYGLKCFAKDLRSCELLLRVDNTTALSYINKMGSIQYPKLSNLCRKIWQWCEERDLWIFASYIKSSENTDADVESRIISEETEWELNNREYRIIENKFGKFDIDLFATNINAKCPKFLSWHRDPDALAVDAFTVCWSQYYFYAFPPFSVISRVLRKIVIDKAEGIVVVPDWPTQTWFPKFRSLLVAHPIYFTPKKDLLLSPFRKEYPLALTLVAGRLSGRRSD